MALPKPTYDWDENWMQTVYADCQSAMKFVSETTGIVSEKYRVCLQRGKEAIIEKMMELIIDRGYFSPQQGTSAYVLCWRDAPDCITKFLRLLENVFTRGKEIKIRKISAPAVGAAANATIPSPTEDWSKNRIKILYENCQCAMKLLENNPAIVSENYRQCLQRGRKTIIEKMMEFIMDSEYFMQYGSSTENQYLYWKSFPPGVARFLQHIETVFIGYGEFNLREKKMVKVRVKAIAIPPKAGLVALVEAPELRLKSGILKRYEQMNFFSTNKESQLEVLRGKRILNEKWAEEGETYELSGEANAMLCMHLWSLMRHVGFSKPEKIWEGISKGWPECVKWKQGAHGKFWTTIQSDEVPLRVQAENKGLKKFLDAYKDMERYFKEDSEHSLIHYKDAYYPKEENPHPSL